MQLTQCSFGKELRCPALQPAHVVSIEIKVKTRESRAVNNLSTRAEKLVLCEIHITAQLAL